MSVWILIRHGESVANSAKYLSGWQDVPLTDKGRTDAINLRPTFQALLNQLKQELGEDAKVQMISSDLQRAVQTGMLVSGNEQIIQDKSFRERHFGIHQGSLKSDLRENGIMNQILSWTSACDGNIQLGNCRFICTWRSDQNDPRTAWRLPSRRNCSKKYSKYWALYNQTPRKRMDTSHPARSFLIKHLVMARLIRWDK